MKRSHFFLLVLAAAVFAALGWHLHRSEKGSWQDTPLPPGAALAGEFPVNDVAEIRLRGPAGAVTLRRGDGGWIVAERAGYAADFDKVSALVRQLAGLKAVQDIPVADADLGRLELRAPGEGVPPEEAAVAVDLRDAQGGGFASLLLGKTHLVAPAGMPPEFGGTPAGRFVRSDKQPGRAYLVTETFADVQASPAAWIAPAYVRPGMARRIEVKGAGPDRSWAIERSAQGAAWNLPGRSAPADASAAMNIDSLFGGMAVADAPEGCEGLTDVITFSPALFTDGVNPVDNPAQKLTAAQAYIAKMDTKIERWRMALVNIAQGKGDPVAVACKALEADNA